MLLLNNIVMAAVQAAEQPAAGAEDASMAGLLMTTVLPFVLIFVVMYFILIRPQRKKEKAMKEMISNVKVGNEITTIGGVIGKVVNIKDDEITIETSIDKTKMMFNKNAIKEIKNYEQA